MGRILYNFFPLLCCAIAFYFVQLEFHSWDMIYAFSSIPAGWILINRLIAPKSETAIITDAIYATRWPGTSLFISMVKLFVKFFSSFLLGFFAVPYYVLVTIFTIVHLPFQRITDN
ncbi:hypothetical protein [Thalassobacillus sp. B23F22_16]|uniref:hypothetical protein n=1 Tax=Thalassobacillus sp. B23F22_16 TaxID=3459513 RepID=UPI00373EBA50